MSTLPEQNPTHGHPERRGWEFKPKIPDYDREYIVLYLLDKIGSLTRSEVKDLADTLRANRNVVLSEMLKKPRHSGVSRLRELLSKPTVDEGLSHLVLSYDEKEETTDKPPEMWGPSDIWAGDGPARPLLKELYSLESARLVNVLGFRQDRGRDEMFRPTMAGQTFAKMMGIIFRSTQWNDYIAEATRSGTRLIERPKFADPVSA